jgi:virulence-associated protein VapD
MDLKKLHIYNLAVLLIGSKKQMTAADLAANLNANGFSTNYGTPYLGMRGTYTLLHSTYEVVERVMGKAQAALIANAFTKPGGGFAWE